MKISKSDKAGNIKSNIAKTLPRIFEIVLIIVVILILATVVYLSKYYKANDEAISAINSPTDNVKVAAIDNGLFDSGYVFSPASGDATVGIIFYPGAKVQCEAYAPLMSELASNGALCVLIKMPGNMAFFNMNAADKYLKEYKNIKHWYMAGHSLGGVVASSYVSKHIDKYDGLIMLASYSTTNLFDSGLDVISIYGSEDGVLDMDSYVENRKNLPEVVGQSVSVSKSGSSSDSDGKSELGQTREYVIQGGCHAYYGCYGAQKGDGTPTISNDEQIEITVEDVCENIEYLNN